MDIHQEANQKAKGKRPWFYNCQEAERVLNIALALAQELAVTRERLDTLECLLQSKGLLSRAEFDSFVPSKAIAEDRSQATQAYLARIFRVIAQENEALSESADQQVSVDELAK
jgi:hypothetical protein